ncbi:MAG: hypothetical protein KatS3mg019_0090 [Fimbriimonadales bacterium]|nr:MAG: hypothetical protein KatS3mg019_0090 [Fimbriimonadales bacterium]
MVDLDALRKEIFGANGFVAKLRRQFGLDSPQHLAERTHLSISPDTRAVGGIDPTLQHALYGCKLIGAPR